MPLVSARSYAGVGARITPVNILKIMEFVAYYLALGGFTLRSGAAKGADSAFEKGADKARGTKRVYLPWARYNGHGSPFHSLPQMAFDLASELHPYWKTIPDAVRRLHARNTLILLGEEFSDRTRVEFVLCWTPQGRDIGGTGQMIRLARRWGVSLFNLGNVDRFPMEVILRKLSDFLLDFGASVPTDSKLIA